MRAARRLPRAVALAGVISLSLLSSACNFQALRILDPTRSAAQAAAETALLEPELDGREHGRPTAHQGPRPPMWWSAGDRGVAPADTAGEHDDIWARIRAGMQLRHAGDERFERELQSFSARPDYLDRTAERGRPYLPYIVDQLDRRGMPQELALLPVIESAFRPRAYSAMRAAGIWQFMPATGRVYGLKQTWWYDGRRDIVHSTRAALDYLQKLATDFDGDWLLAIAAYNAGEGNVQRAIERNRRRGKPTDFWSLDLPRETEAHVPRLLAIAAIVADPASHGVVLAPIPDEQYFDVVELDGQIELALAADLADISLEELKDLNPGFHRWATDPDGPHELVLPAGSSDLFVERLASVPLDERVRWSHHKVRSGDTLGHLAARYGTSVSALQRLNKLGGTRIRVGQSLLVPARDGVLASADVPPQGAAPRATARYRVRSGDSLWTIARRHGTSVRQLARLNDLSSRSVLRPGQELLVARAMTGTSAGGAADGLRRISYTVRPGDSLWEISRRFRVSVGSLKRWNSLHGSALKPGQRLDVYVPQASAT